MAQYTQLNELIATLRAATAPGSITPENHGYILKKIADILVTLVTATDLQTTAASLESQISGVQSTHNQDYAHLQDLLDDKADLHGDYEQNFTARRLFIKGENNNEQNKLQISKASTNYGNQIGSDWLRLRNIDAAHGNTLYECYIPVPQVGSATAQYIIATRSWVEDKIRNINVQPGEEVDLTGYYTSEEVDNLLSNYATAEALQNAISSITIPELTGYATQEWCNQHFMLPNNTYTRDDVDRLLAAKQNTLTFDDEPTAGSTNPVKSAGIKSALNNKQDKFKIVVITKTNGVYSSETTFAEVINLLNNGQLVMYNYNNVYYQISDYRNNYITAFSIIGDVIARIEHQPTEISRQTDVFGNTLDNQLEEKYAMIVHTKNLLDSMGDTIDNYGNTSGTQIHYVASDGDYYFKPATGKICRLSGSTEIVVGDPDPNMIYGNKMNNKLHIWNGTTFIEYA